MKSKAKTKHLDDDSEDDSGSHDNSVDHASATPSDSLRRSSRRRAVPKAWVTRPKKETAGYWTTAEKEKLLLHLDQLNTQPLCKSHYLRLYRYPFPYIRKRIKSKSIAQIKCFMSMLEHRKGSAVMTKMKQQSPLESWRELADKLTMLGNDDCCRQLIRVCSVMALESTEDKDDTTKTTADTAPAATRKRYRRPSTKTATAAAMTTASAAAVRAAQVLAATGRKALATTAATAPEALAAMEKAASTITSTIAASTITAASTSTASVAEPVTAAATTATVVTTILEASTTATATATAAEPAAATAATTSSAVSTTAETAAEPPTATTATAAAPITATTAVTPTRTCQPFVDTTINKPTLVPMPDGRFMAIPNTPASSIVKRQQTTISEADMPPLKPNYASIYKYIGGIMQGNKKELGPLESMIVLDCLKMVEDHLKIRNNKNEKEFMQDRFFDIFQKLYLSIDQEDALDIKKETDYLDPVTVSTLLPNKSPIGGQVETENSPEEIEEMDTAQNGLADAEMMDQSEEALASGLEDQSEDNLQGENENEGPQNSNSERRISVEAHRERRLKLELGSLNPFNIPVQRLEIRKDK